MSEPIEETPVEDVPVEEETPAEQTPAPPEQIEQPDGSILPPGYVPADMYEDEPAPTPPPDGMSWEEFLEQPVGDF